MTVVYRNVVMDSSRWEGFAFRDGDIVISTPPKCGTTWTQMICALLIFQTPDLPSNLDLLSPWLDMQTRKVTDVVADLEAQTHRRFIKSHTPLDGLPWDERVTYITVARDPRDTAMSWDNHMDNLDLGALMAQRDAAVGLDDLAELMPDGPPPVHESLPERFRYWVETEAGIGGLGGLSGMLHHLRTFWDRREEPNIVLLHYADMKADLQGQMRALAGRLGIDVPEPAWPELVEAATFESMKARATNRAPNTSNMLWKDASRFFNKGTSGQWREQLGEDDLRRYDARVRELTGDDAFHDWVHNGSLAPA